MMNSNHSKLIAAAVFAGLTLGIGSVSLPAQTSDARVTAAEARADAAEKRAQVAEERAEAAEERARRAEERARAAEARVVAAEARAKAAVKRAKSRTVKKKSKSPTFSSSGLSRSQIERLERKQFEERLIRSRRRD